MTKSEFISELESLLQDISEEERLEAIQFYQNYFDDAGLENEQRVLSELGSPSKVAQTIKADLNSGWQEANNRGYFTENGYEDNAFTEAKYEIIKGEVNKEETEKIPLENNNEKHKNNNNHYNSQNNNYKDNKSYNFNNKSSASKIILIILCIFAIPVGIPLIASVFSVLISIAATVFFLWLSFAITSAALIISGIIVVFAGIIKFITLPAIGLCLAGGGLIILGFGLLFTMATIGISSKLFPLIPELFRGFINLCRLPFQNRRVAA